MLLKMKFSAVNVRTNAGFSMLELLIVLAIVGILAAIAYPNYTSYVQKTKRSDAHLALYAAVQAMERCKSTRYTYSGCTLASSTSPEQHYDLALSPAPTATNFVIVATAKGEQVSDKDCTSLSIDQRGTLTSTPGTVDCWNK